MSKNKKDSFRFTATALLLIVLGLTAVWILVLENFNY